MKKVNRGISEKCESSLKFKTSLFGIKEKKKFVMRCAVVCVVLYSLVVLFALFYILLGEFAIFFLVPFYLANCLLNSSSTFPSAG